MTGRDLIVYILENNLENEPLFENDSFLNFVSINEAALKTGVGISTIKALYELGVSKGIKIGDNIYISKEVK